MLEKETGNPKLGLEQSEDMILSSQAVTGDR
jgi:hypothetical protein